MTQKNLDDLQGVGKTILIWVAILSGLATVVLGWDQIFRNKKANASQSIEIKANSDYVIEDKIHKEQLQKDVATIMADVKSLMLR